MSINICSQATAPINIDTNNKAEDCKLKCNYIYDYPPSICNISNKGNYLQIEYTKSGNSPVNYNNSELIVSDFRIYVPSLHTYDGEQADGEIIISHTGTLNLLVCIPLVISSSLNDAQKNLKDIITLASKQIPSIGESTSININNFTINNFIPPKEFYVYNATLPYNPCSGNNTIIVFPKKKSIAFIAPSVYALLQKMITKSAITTKPNKTIFINPKGPIYKKSPKEDDIYIDCQHVDITTDQDNDGLFSSQNSGFSNTPRPTASSGSSKMSSTNYTIILVIVGILIAIALILLLRRFM